MFVLICVKFVCVWSINKQLNDIRFTRTILAPHKPYAITHLNTGTAYVKLRPANNCSIDTMIQCQPISSSRLVNNIIRQ